jgi:transcriptional regulator GlxA family with amidase domain
VADVVALAAEEGPIRMRPAITLQPQATIGQFDERYRQGADYVVVPAVPMEHIGDARLVGWLRAQAAKGATIVSICDGALVVGKAGLFDGHRATGHWATQAMREREFPSVRWLTNVRYVDDGAVISSAGVTAAVPLSLALVEAIGGPERAAAVAREIGVQRWDSTHRSQDFRLRLQDYLTYARNSWLSGSDRIELPVRDGVDELALALAADALGRTERARVFVTGTSQGPVRTRGGLLLQPDPAAQGEGQAVKFVLPDAVKPVAMLELALQDIGRRYGQWTADFVSLQLEYPR